jgi:hypothetical protein
MRLFLSLILSLIFLLSVSFGHSQPAGAIISQQEEAPGQILSQSRHSLRDSRGESWQVILFKQVKDGKVTNLNLRLVGFPNTVAFFHPRALLITTRQGAVFQAPDQFAEKSPAPNVGQYDLKEILPQLPANQSLKLTLPLNKEQTLSLDIPFPVVLEWQEILYGP